MKKLPLKLQRFDIPDQSSPPPKRIIDEDNLRRKRMYGLTKKRYTDWYGVLFICCAMFIIYFAICANIFFIRNPLAPKKLSTYKHVDSMLKMERLEEYQHSYENFMDILKKEGLRIPETETKD